MSSIRFMLGEARRKDRCFICDQDECDGLVRESGGPSGEPWLYGFHITCVIALAAFHHIGPHPVEQRLGIPTRLHDRWLGDDGQPTDARPNFPSPADAGRQSAQRTAYEQTQHAYEAGRQFADAAFMDWLNRHTAFHWTHAPQPPREYRSVEPDAPFNEAAKQRAKDLEDMLRKATVNPNEALKRLQKETDDLLEQLNRLFPKPPEDKK